MLYKVCLKSHSLQEDLETETEAPNKKEAFWIFRQQLAFADYNDTDLYNMIEEIK